MGWLSNLGHAFSHPPAPLPRRDEKPSGDSVEDWHAGDLAECMHRGPWQGIDGKLNHVGPQRGEVRLVKAVTIHLHPEHGLPVQFLAFTRDAPALFSATAFRKVTPRADALERGELEFIGLDAPSPIDQPAAPREPEKVG